MNIRELIKEEGGEIVYTHGRYVCRWTLKHGRVVAQVSNGAAGMWAEVIPEEEAFSALVKAITKKYQPLVYAARKLEGIDFHDSVSIWGCVIDEIQDTLSTLDKEG